MTPVRTAAAFCIALVGHLRWRLAVSAIVALAVAFTEGAGVLLIIPLLGSIGLTVTDGPTSGLADSSSCRPRTRCSIAPTSC